VSWVPRRIDRGAELLFAEHLEEFRRRIIVVGMSVLLASAAAFAIHGKLLDWLNRPLPVGHRHLVGLGVAEPFAVTLTVCLYTGVVIAIPVALWQLWAFVGPAVDNEYERLMAILVTAAAGLAAGGGAFAYYIVLPRAVRWLTTFDSRHFVHVVQAKSYYSFVVAVIVGLILVFELPLAILGLVEAGVLTSGALRRNRRRGYFVVAVIALGLPGPDIYTTLLELLPMWVLFEASIWLAVLTERRKRSIPRPVQQI
jgi:sec-independent protein translocase protein TatC